MKSAIRLMAIFILPLSVSGCLSSGGSTGGTASVLVSEVVSVCGAVVGGPAEERINQEWAKYPDAQANRGVIETMAEVLLNDPTATEQQRSSQYKSYMTCATGMLVANGVGK